MRLLHNYLQERHIEFGNKKTGEIKNFSLYKFALLKLQWFIIFKWKRGIQVRAISTQCAGLWHALPSLLNHHLYTKQSSVTTGKRQAHAATGQNAFIYIGRNNCTSLENKSSIQKTWVTVSLSAITQSWVKFTHQSTTSTATASMRIWMAKSYFRNTRHIWIAAFPTQQRSSNLYKASKRISSPSIASPEKNMRVWASAMSCSLTSSVKNGWDIPTIAAILRNALISTAKKK